MIIATIAAALSMSTMFVNNDPIKCAVMGSPTKASSAVVEYAGSRFPICCSGCSDPLMKDPAKYLKASTEAGNTVASFMFCPISGQKLDWKKVTESVDYKGVRYGFCCADCKGVFTKDSAKYAKTPEKESLVCAMSGEKIASYSEAGGFVDYEGVRYYTCCPDCLVGLKKDPAGTIAKGKAKASVPKAMLAPKAK